MNKNKAKKWFFGFLGGIIIVAMVWAAIIVVVDPYFHYHKPLPFLSYRLYEERYINDGIGRQFDYDAIITGTSMTQNFKTSEFDELFGVKSVKMPFSGGGFQEISGNLDRSLDRNPDCKTVLYGIDYYGLIRDYDWDQYGGEPTYLYDNNILNDSSYLFNKDIMLTGAVTNILWTLQGRDSTTFDEYASWGCDTGLQAIYDSGFERPKEISPMVMDIPADDYARIIGTIEKVLTPVVEEHPDVTFYLFFTPYSIVSFDELYRDGRMEEQFKAEEMVAKALLQYDNVRLYEFFEDHDTINDLENYRDKEHYDADINSLILQYISRDEYRLTMDNLDEHMQYMREYYLNYDYDSIYAQ
ncbi:MAG: hypothetical protein PHP50_12655 [Lachnospiraceae bacterium]|nr:hypothetical protein [Lachnospiraceae bacterium]